MACGLEPAGLALRVIEDQLLDLGERHAGLCRGIPGFDAEDDVEWRDAELAQRQLPRLDDSAGGIVQALDRAADLGAVAEQLERPEVEHRLGVGARRDVAALIQPGVFTLGPLIRSSSRCVSDVPDRGVRATSSSGGGASPCAIAASVLAVRDVLPRTI